MKTLYIECNMGAAGDMLMAALLELHPNPDGFIKRMNNLGIPGVIVNKEVAVKSGITGTQIRVRVGDQEEESLDVPFNTALHSHDHTHHSEEPQHNHSHHHDHEHHHSHNHDHEDEHNHNHAIAHHHAWELGRRFVRGGGVRTERTVQRGGQRVQADLPQHRRPGHRADRRPGGDRFPQHRFLR